MIDPLDIDGEEPNVVGQTCDELLAEEYSQAGEVVASANVVHLCFGGVWHRLHFDCGIVFWRSSSEAPKPCEMAELNASVRIIDLAERYGVRGARLERIETRALTGGAEVALHFAEGGAVRFRNVDDVTSHSD